MLNLKHISKRTLRRDRNDDLSIVTGGRPSIRVGGSKGAFNSKRVRNYDQKLKQEFLNARAFAYHSQIVRPSASCAAASSTNRLAHLNRSMSAVGKENDLVSSLIFPLPHAPHEQNENVLGPQRQQRSEVTINCVPSLVKTSQSRQAVLSASQPRGILKPSFSNQMYGHASATPPSQPQCWSMYANNGAVVKPRISSTIYNMNTRGGNKHTSTWKVCSTAPITREDASLLQMEMISTINGESSGRNSVSRYFGSTPVPGQGLENLHGRYPASRQEFLPPPSLVRSIVPPSPLFPVPSTPAESIISNTSSYNLPSNFNGCGVHQSEWIDRSKCFTGKAPTKQYSMEQLIDILCGFATPDSIMAAQLFQPCPTPGPPTPMKNLTNQLPLSAHWNASSNQTNIFTNTNENQQANEADDDDGETSIYFRNVEVETNATTTNPKKSVTFLTDGSDNICVNEIMFDPFSQDNFNSGSSRSSSAEKENIMHPSFDNIFPHPTQQDATVFNSLENILPSPTQHGANIFNNSDIPSTLGFQFNCFELPELTGQLFDSQTLDGNISKIS